MTMQNNFGRNPAIDLREFVAILRRRARLVILTYVIMLGAAFLYLARTTPLYTATTMILIDPAQKDLLQPSDSGNLNSSLASSLIESEVEILKSDTVMLALIDNMNLTSDPEFGPSLSLKDKVKQVLGFDPEENDGAALLRGTLTRVRDAVSVRRKGLTNIITASFTSADPDRAAELANALAAAYVHLQVEAKSNSFLDAKSVLERQLASAQAALASSDASLSDYIDNNLDRLERESGSSTISALRQQLERANRERVSAKFVADQVDSALASQDWDSLVATLQNDAINALDNQRQALANRLEQAEAGTSEAVNLRAGLARIEAQIATEGEAALAGLRSNVANYTSSADTLHEDIRRELLGGNLSPETLSELYVLQQESTIAQRQYDNLLNRMHDLEAQALAQISNARVVSQAIAPGSASSPKSKLVLAMALVASLGLGLALAFLSEFYIGGIHSAGQLANIIGARVGAVIPLTPQTSDQHSIADTIIDAPMSAYAESLRRLRSSIDRFSTHEKDEALTIMVSSSIPAEGKSTVALSLARTYAAAGMRPLLIDADMRKPAIHTQMGISPEAGLLDYLTSSSEEAESSDCFDVDPRARVGTIFGHGRPNIPTDQLFQTERFRNLVADARKSFDVVIIDTPPLLPVVDARYIASLADCVLLCVRASEATQTDVRSSYEQLKDHIIDDSTNLMSVLTFQAGWQRGYKPHGYYY
ncbi:MAG: Wzz/FepE/Etk N-terminal domain-containing protein [Maritimibacter sp.]